MSRAEIQAVLGGDSQALLRSLNALIEANELEVQGQTKGRKYRARSQSPASGIAFSPEASEALALLDRPLELRAPASFRRAFLDEWSTRHRLPLELRARLHALGRTPAQQERQPAGTWARHVLERFLLDLTWNSARLEGNTYSLLDTERLLREGQEANGKSTVETQMLLNHKQAIEFMVAEPMTAALDERTVLSLHALLLENLLGHSLDEGRLRSTAVQIGRSTYLPLANPQLIAECFAQVLITAQQLDDAFDRCFFLLVQLPYLQPFIDGNKRTARLAANLPLIIENLMPLSFVDVPLEVFQRAMLAVYELNRPEPMRDLFVWAYERSASRLSQVQSSLGEPDPFRLEHRTALAEAIRGLIVEAVPLAMRRDRLLAYAHAKVPSVVPRFVATAESLLDSLNDASASRFRVRPSEYAAWRAVNPTP